MTNRLMQRMNTVATNQQWFVQKYKKQTEIPQKKEEQQYILNGRYFTKEGWDLQEGCDRGEERLVC